MAWPQLLGADPVMSEAPGNTALESRFERIFAQFSEPIFNYVLRIVGDRDRAADITQDTFIKAYRKLDTLADDASTRSWIYRIATNTAIDDMRRRRYVTPFDSHPDELISASLTGDLTDLERRELEAHLSSCPECRDTLEAFSQQRQMLAGMRQSPLPRDLAARVRTGIESRRFAMPWYRRPSGWLTGVASVTTVAVAALLTVVFLNGRGHPTAQASASPSPSPTVSAAASASPSPVPTAAPLPLNMQAGDLLYVQLTGPIDDPKLTVIEAQSAAKVGLANPGTGQYSETKRAALSPDGRALAFATETGAKGSWRIVVASLANGATKQLAETWPVAFGRRIAWSPDGRYLAFTVASVEANGTSDVWLYDRTSGSARQLTHAGNAYFASWAPQNAGNEQLWVSLGEANPDRKSVV